MQAKRVQFGDGGEYPEITQDMLFNSNGDENAGEVKLNEENANASSKNIDNPNQSPDDTKKRFSALAKIMRQCGLGGDILQKIDFKDLQFEVLEVISILLGKRELLPEDT